MTWALLINSLQELLKKIYMRIKGWINMFISLCCSVLIQVVQSEPRTLPASVIAQSLGGGGSTWTKQQTVSDDFLEFGAHLHLTAESYPLVGEESIDYQDKHIEEVRIRVCSWTKPHVQTRSSEIILFVRFGDSVRLQPIFPLVVWYHVYQNKDIEEVRIRYCAGFHLACSNNKNKTCWPYMVYLFIFV